jgi:fatty-acyl-CoA synthase
MATRLVCRPDSPLKMWARALERVAPITGSTSITLPALINDLADGFESAPALLDDNETLSYRALAQRCNQYARWGLAHSLGKGDVVCLLMTNRPDYMAIWLGLARIGVTVALINTNLAGAALAHSINTAAPKHIIIGENLINALVAALSHIGPGLQCWVHGQDTPRFPRIDRSAQCLATGNLAEAEFEPPSIKDRALYIYTSGTTGLPKAAYVSHLRLMRWSHWFAGMMDTRPNDRIYNCLPMYHSIGGVVATGALLVSGGSVVVRQHFSASRFWAEVSDWNCTLFQYIGELCRYLVDSPWNPREADHSLRLCCGNGLRADIWHRFQERFHLPQILEFYAATEANFSLYNCEGHPGAIGRIPSFLAHRFPIALIKSDGETGEPIRGGNGICVRCAPNEVGEAIGEIIDDDDHPGSRFEGYTDQIAADKKILRNVFAPGDTWFRTGDLMHKDHQGFYYFIDRIGDTFRWKGENVSTAEVAAAISACAGVTAAVVYGVSIPRTEGRAGMAAVTVSQNFDLVAFRRHLRRHLPDYACPLFLRMCQAIEMTATFKSNKQRLLREAYNPAMIVDPLYFDDPVSGEFIKLDVGLYDSIQSGSFRL